MAIFQFSVILDFRDIFKSTPNLKDMTSPSSRRNSPNNVTAGNDSRQGKNQFFMTDKFEKLIKYQFVFYFENNF